EVSVVQALLSLQPRGVPPVQTPAWQVSTPLQRSPSGQGVPFASAVCRQPASGSHVSVVQGLASAQLRADPGVQAPAWQVSAPLHTFPSLHDVPFATARLPQPATGSQLSVVHGLLSLQLGGAPGAHTPGWQVSAPLHAFPSLHGAPASSGSG